jgi:hypothetical protein
MKPAMVLILADVGLSGCIRTVGSWDKPGTTQDAFNVDKFQCMQASQPQVSQLTLMGTAAVDRLIKTPTYRCSRLA